MVRRMARWLRHAYYTKVLRQQGSPEYIARGVALGLLVGWLIPIGFQLAVVIPLAFLLRAAKIPAVVFTFVSNHFTVIVLYPLQCWLGSLVLGYHFGYDAIAGQVMSIADAESWRESWARFWELGAELGSSFMVGGLLLGVPSAVAGYAVTVHLVGHYRRFKERRKILKSQKTDRADDPAQGKD